MIIAKFQQKHQGTLYQKGDSMDELPEKYKAQLVQTGHAKWKADLPNELPDDSWTVSEIKDFMDEYSILYTSDMLKADLLDKIQSQL
jgi:hypothetical protein